MQRILPVEYLDRLDLKQQGYQHQTAQQHCLSEYDQMHAAWRSYPYLQCGWFQSNRVRAPMPPSHVSKDLLPLTNA